MQSKKIRGKGIVLTVLSAVGTYAFFSFLAAALCLNEVVSKEQMGGVYFAIGFWAAVFSGIVAVRFSGMKRIWAVLTALAALILTVMAARSGGEVSESAVWLYAGAAVGAIGVLLKRGKGKSGGKHRKVVKRKR